jgi:hypothetical protein
MFACSDDGDDPPPGVQPTLTSLWNYSFFGCGINCHTSDPDSGVTDGTEDGPDMSTKDNFYVNLIGKSASDYQDWVKDSNCNSVSFITPGKANESSLAAALILSISDDLAAKYNCVTAYSEHVVNKQAISDDTLKNALITWINNGAQNN